jgi:hypothetical protein
MSGFFDKLKQKIFDSKSDKEWLKDAQVSEPKKTSPKSLSKKSKSPTKTSRDPYFIQIGFDFGTSSSKVVCRDVIIDKAWVHIPKHSKGQELPFLMSSSVCFRDGVLSPSTSSSGEYVEGGLYHLKMALEKVGLDQQDDPILTQSRAVLPSGENLETFVVVCITYLLAHALGDVRKSIRNRFLGDVTGDQIRVNMAVPVADANVPKVEELFNRVLRQAWVLADEISEHSDLSYLRVVELINANTDRIDSALVKDECYLYPEVSANVQGFIRSRSSQPGIYVFSDTGAGTVDQSVFIFSRRDGEESLNYLHAQVIPLGSGHIERIASGANGTVDWNELEKWRLLKEAGETHPRLMEAKQQIGGSLTLRSKQTIHFAKVKLQRRAQINDLKVIFGGGGHSEQPYGVSVLRQFDEPETFRADLIKKRRYDRDVFELGMPVPSDLGLKSKEKRWAGRLSVAYGLAFERSQLAAFKLPGDVITLKSPIRRRKLPHAPTKDDC